MRGTRSVRFGLAGVVAALLGCGGPSPRSDTAAVASPKPKYVLAAREGYYNAKSAEAGAREWSAIWALQISAKAVEIPSSTDAGRSDHLVLLGACDSPQEVESILFDLAGDILVYRSATLGQGMSCPHHRKLHRRRFEAFTSETQRDGTRDFHIDSHVEDCDGVVTTQRLETKTDGQRLSVLALRSDVAGVLDVRAPQARPAGDLVVSNWGHRLILWSDDDRVLDWTQLWSPYSCDGQEITVQGATVTVTMRCEELCHRAYGLASVPLTDYWLSDRSGHLLSDGTCPYPLVGAGCVGDGYSYRSITQLCKLSPDRWGELRKRVTYTYAANGDKIESTMRVEYLDDPDQCNQPLRRPR